ncbi:MAG: DUF255 domain-containing protein [Arhodomonas sp.]|nr:DUF255 domain-containing protein [Arhodomonas sp.]
MHQGGPGGTPGPGPHLPERPSAAHRAPGGWPLTVFLTPDQVPFFAGTYFPPAPAHGMPAFDEVLERVGGAWKEQRGSIDAQNERMIEALAALQAPPTGEGAVDDAAQAARDALAAEFDRDFGGFGDAPKFPRPASLSHLLAHYAAEDDREALHMVARSLQRMGLGGIFDQVGGGFARYSVDRYWMIPHFEKMLCDNALLLGVYADAWRVTGDELFARVVEETVDWLQREMRVDDGGFASAVDADSADGEGAYYLWTPDEIRATLPPQEARLVIHRFGLDGRPNFHGRWHLHVHATFSELAAGLGEPRERLRQRWESARLRLQQARSERPAPARDDKRLTAWNALAAWALARAGRLLGREDWQDEAAATLAFVDGHLWRGGRLLARYALGEAEYPAYLDDHAYLLWALLEQLQGRWEDRWLERAGTVADLLLERFENPVDGGFYFTADDHEPLIQRPYGFSDDALPNGGAVATRALLRLAALTGKGHYQEAAERAIEAARGAVGRAPPAHCAMLEAVLEANQGVETVLIRAPATDDVEAWRRAAEPAFSPFRQVFVLPAGSAPGLGPARGARVCRVRHCLPDAHTPEALADLLQTQA